MFDSIMLLSMFILLIGAVGIIISGYQYVSAGKYDDREAAKNRIAISGLIFSFAMMVLLFTSILKNSMVTEAEKTIVVDDLYVREVVNARVGNFKQCVVIAGEEQYIYEASDMKEARAYCDDVTLNSSYHVIYKDAGSLHYYIKEMEYTGF